MPRPFRIQRLDQIANRSVEVHSVATKAVIGEVPLCVVPGIGEDFSIGCAVRPCMPRRVLVLMALLALRCHRQHISIAQMNRFWRGSEQMHANVPKLRPQTCIMTVHTCGGPMRRRVYSAGKRCHLVATRAALTVLRGVVVGRTIHQNIRESRNERSGKDDYFEDTHHDRKAVPFQLLISDAEA